MMKYMINQMKRKATGQATSSYAHEQTKEAKEDGGWYNKHQLTTTYGEDTANEWIAALTEQGRWRKCKITGSDAPHLRQYRVVVDTDSRKDTNKDSLTGSATSVASAAELDQIRSLGEEPQGQQVSGEGQPKEEGQGQDSDEQPLVQAGGVKKEPKTNEEVINDRFQEFMSSPEQIQRMMSNCLGDLDISISKGVGVMYCEDLVADMRRFKTKVGRVKNTFNKAIEDPSAVSNRHALLSLLDSIEPERKKLHDASVRFGLVAATKRRRTQASG